jgi:polysaccharide chain length determinant protein (PEP-CTERM system associated)
MPLRPNMEPGEFLDILRRRKWVILFSVLLIHIGSVVYCVLIPDMYRSTMKLLVIPPTVSEGMVRSTVSIESKDRLKMLQQDILSRSRLMGVINELDLFKGESRKMSSNAMVDKVRKRIDMEFEGKNSFILFFQHENPEVAMRVTSRLGSFFVEENIRSREATAQETSKFLADEVEETRKRLEAQEEKVKRYKLQFGGELPQQEQANLNRLQRLQDQIKNNSDAIARLADRKVFLEAQISNIERNARGSDNQDPWETVGSGDQASPNYLLSELAMRKKKLQELSNKYTPLYPSVVEARWEVEQLEGKIAAMRQAARKDREDSARGTAKPSTPKSTPDLEPTNGDIGEMRRLRGQVAAINLEVVALKRESVNAVQTTDQIQRKVERLPQREQELISLSRDYDNIKKSYEELLKKKLDSQVSQKLEEKQKGEQFQVLEPANLPTRPFKPDRPMVLGLALLASLVIGVGGSIGLEMLDPTLRGSKEFRSFFDIPILACLPVIQDDRLNRRLAVRRAAVVGGLVSMLGVYLVFLVVNGGKVKAILLSIGQSIGVGQ